MYKYNKRLIIAANKNSVDFWLDNKGLWLRQILHDADDKKGINDYSSSHINKFITQFAKEIELYQSWMFEKGKESK